LTISYLQISYLQLNYLQINELQLDRLAAGAYTSICQEKNHSFGEKKS
jgi:hypothetical protein